MPRRKRADGPNADTNGNGNTRSTALTIHDVAKAAGVATSTVSRALSGDGRVSDETRRHVREIADRLGYRPSRSARALRGANTHTLGFIGPDFSNMVALQHLQASIRAAYQQGYTIFVCDTQGSADILTAQIARFVEHRVDGILLGRGVLSLSAEAERLLARSGIPIEPPVQLSPDADQEQPRFLNAYIDRAQIERGASIVAFRHLFELGHRRVAYFTRPSARRTEMGDTRRATLRKAAADAGLPDDAIIEVVTQSVEECTAEVQHLAGLEEPPTAIVCANGMLTPAILRGIFQAGWRVPDDISFMTYGDSIWHEAQHPPVAVIRHNYEAAAERSLHRLIARTEGREDVPDPPRRPAEFFPRGSLGPARQRDQR